MTIDDRLYGEMEIEEPVLVELLTSKLVVRLRGIAQYGVPDPYYHLNNYSRYEHSVGVLLLLRKLGAGLEEQVAGLLHDVSHTAFSHVVDWVLGSGKTEDFQDEQHGRVLEESEVPVILNKHGLSMERITDYHHFGLLERDAPDLCADRVDYALREFSRPAAEEIIDGLRVRDDMMVLVDKERALLMGREYLKLQREHWGGFEAASRYRLFADIVREAMEKKVVAMGDFWRDDAFVVDKMVGSGDEQLLKQLEVLKAKSLAHLPKSEMVVHKKFRYVDPLFIVGDRLVRVSEADVGFKKEIEKARVENEKGVRIARIDFSVTL